MSLMSLKKLSNLLPSFFLQTHRSFIANMKYVNAIKGDNLLIDTIEVPIGGAYKNEVTAYVMSLN
jgi:DNA-binding LytR/AlgR family response regulator